MKKIMYKRILTDYNFNINASYIAKSNYKKAVEHYKNDNSIYCFTIYDEAGNEKINFNRDFAR